MSPITLVVLAIISKGWWKRADRLDKYHFKHIKTKRIPLPLSVMRRLVVKDWLPAMDRYLGKGVYFFPDYNTWKLAGSLAITTIHDLSFIDVPQYVDTVNGKFMTISLRRSVERASKIATVTNSMKQDIMRHNNLRDRDRKRSRPKGILPPQPRRN